MISIDGKSRFDQLATANYGLIFIFIRSCFAWGNPISENTVFHGRPGVKLNTSKSGTITSKVRIKYNESNIYYTYKRYLKIYT